MNKKNNPVETFRQNIDSVHKLINFDQVVQDIAIKAIEELHAKLVKNQGITNPQLNGERTLQILKSIRTNNALKARYRTIYNQAVVLLVSYFGSVLSDIFRYTAKISVQTCKDKRVLNEEIKLQVGELLTLDQNIPDAVGDLLITKKDISFQDMKSVHRAFRDYFGVKVDKGHYVNDIILGQACRHSIVHEGGVVNSRVLNQVREAKPRGLKKDIKLGEEIDFSVEEIDVLSKSMLHYAEELMRKVESYGQSTNSGT